MVMYIRSPSARLAMRALGPFLMHLCWYIILRRVALPIMPTTNTITEMMVLMYLKYPLMEVFTRHIGGGTGCFTTVEFTSPVAPRRRSDLVLGPTVLWKPGDWRVERTRNPESDSSVSSALFIWHIPLAAIQAISSNIRAAGVPIMEHVRRFDCTPKISLVRERNTNGSRKNVLFFR